MKNFICWLIKHDLYQSVFPFLREEPPPDEHEKVLNLDPIGGIVYIGGYITDVWVNSAWRGKDRSGFSLYKELRKFYYSGVVMITHGASLLILR
jgi:hypothetical protein